MFSAFLGETTREDFIPYTADFLLQVEDVKWTIVSGIVGGQLIVSVRNLGYSRNAGEFVKANFGDIGSAGGHRAMAKAVVPIERFRAKFGDLMPLELATKIGDLAEAFLSEAPDKTAREPVQTGVRPRPTPAPDPDPPADRPGARGQSTAAPCRASRRRPQAARR